VSLPDVDVRAMMRETHGSMSMVAGDFVVRFLYLVGLRLPAQISRRSIAGRSTRRSLTV